MRAVGARYRTSRGTVSYFPNKAVLPVEQSINSAEDVSGIGFNRKMRDCTPGNDADPLYLLGRSEQVLNRDKDAKKRYQQVLAKDPRHVDTLAALQQMITPSTP